MQFQVGGRTVAIGIDEAYGELLDLASDGTDATQQIGSELLERVAAWLTDRGFQHVTHTTAWSFWRFVFWQVEQLRKSHQQEADIAFWYKINPWELSSEQKAGLLANMVRVQSQQILQQGNYDKTDYESIYKLTLAATGDEQRARRARARAREAYVDAMVARAKPGR